MSLLMHEVVRMIAWFGLFFAVDMIPLLGVAVAIGFLFAGKWILGFYVKTTDDEAKPLSREWFAKRDAPAASSSPDRQSDTLGQTYSVAEYLAWRAEQSRKADRGDRVSYEQMSPAPRQYSVGSVRH